MAVDDLIERALNYSAKSDAPIPDPIEWIEANFYIPETMKPIQLMDYQKAVIREALSKDDDGLFKYSTILYSDCKKTAKSTCSAAAALYLAWHYPYETVRIVGNDLKQADSRTFTYIRRAIELNPDMNPLCHISQYRIELPNRTIIQAVPVDPKGEAGGGDLITCYTELWGYKNEASKKMWVETALSPLKFGKSLRWCESYAGYIGESPVLELLYQMGVKEGTPVDVGIPDLELWRTGRQLTLWNTKPRCYWLTPEYYASEERLYTPEEFQRIHRNQWSTSTTKFVPMEWWDSCKGVIPPLRRLDPIVIAIDAAVSSDLFAMVGVSRAKGVVYVRYVNTWHAGENGKIDFDEPFKELNRLARQYPIEQVVFDEYQMAYFASLMTQKGLVYMQPFSQQKQRLEADRQLYDAIAARAIVHDGDPTLREHVQNANREVSPQDNRLRIVKRKPELKIDAIVACSMAHNAIIELEIGAY